MTAASNNQLKAERDHLDKAFDALIAAHVHFDLANSSECASVKNMMHRTADALRAVKSEINEEEES